jgi:hypothetical protein
MRVAVLGSWRDEDVSGWKLRGTAGEFGAACRQVGAELIRRGHSLVIGSGSHHTADGNAARGAIEALNAAGPPGSLRRILVIRPGEDDRARREVDEFLDVRRTRPGLVVPYDIDAASWAAVKFVQVQFADAVILVGGAEKTEQAGLAAIVSRKPLACIGSFGGAAAALNRRFLAAPAIWGLTARDTRDLPLLQEPFGPLVLGTALDAAWIEGAPKLMIVHGRSPDRDVLERYLRERVGRVIVLANEFAPTEPIPTKFERFASSVDGAIVLLTPDDVGGLAGEGAATAPRARENVWIEVGWFWGRRGRGKLLLLRKGGVGVPSDLGNVEHYEYDTSPEECSAAIERFIARLRSASDDDAA